MTSKYISVQHNYKVATQVEQDLQLSKVLINCIPDAAFCLSSDAKIIYVNDATCELVEYSSQELCSMTLQALEPSFSDRSWSKRWQTLEQQGFVSFKSRYQTKKGQLLPLAISIHYADINGKAVGCVFAKHNSDMALSGQELANSPTQASKHLRQEVDELKQKELELETSLSLVHSILESATNGIFALNFAGDVLRCNQKFIDMWRVPDATLLSKKGSSTQAFFENQVKDPQALRKSIWEVPSDCETENYDIIELKDGRIFAQYSQPQRLNGEIIGRVWSIWDISEFKWTEQAISCNHSGFSTLAETTQTIIFILQEEQIRYVNSAMETVCGYKKVELLGDFDLQKLVKHRERRRSQLLQTPSNLPQYQEMKIVTKSGQERTLACSIGMLDFAGKPAELVMAIDITKHKNAEAEVHQALEQAKQLGELKQRFVSMLCHQFRTPLNIISFSADSLKRNVHQWTEEKQLTYVSHIQIAAMQIDRLLDEVLFFGKLEATKLSYEPTLVDLEQLCHKIVKQVQLASDRPTKIEFALKGDRTCYLDRKLLRPILNNLLANALKYSPADSTVNLEVTCQVNEAIFQVKDRGIGIPASDLQNLFEPFHRGSNVDGIPGTGLGLAMVKTLVDIHGGCISVDSEVNTGTTFTIVLPILKNPPIEHEQVQTLQSI